MMINVTKNEIEKIKEEAFAQAIAELKQEFSNDFIKLQKLNEIELGARAKHSKRINNKR